MILQSLGRLRDSASKLDRCVHAARQMTNRFAQASDAELKSRSCDLRGQWEGAKSVPRESLGQALALAAVAVERTLGFAPFDEQLLGAAAIVYRRVIDMKTGEGKSVVAVMAAYAFSLLGRGVHLSTTNAYLAERDAEQAEGILDRLGVSIGLVHTNSNPAKNKAAYQCDVTVGPGYQFGFDFLKDQATLRKNHLERLGGRITRMLHGGDADTLIQPAELSFAIVDEADSVLIDEASTPLILSGAKEKTLDGRPFEQARELARALVEGTDFMFESPERISLSVEGERKARAYFVEMPRLELERPWSLYLENALAAQHVYRRDQHYVVADNQVKIVDTWTGRIFDDRSWQSGLHQAVEAKEGVPFTPSREILARVTRQRFFQRYDMVTGLTGTVGDLADEIRHVYGARRLSIPTHRPCARVAYPTRFFSTREAKLRALVAEISRTHASGRPLLIGTRTIHESKLLAERLRQAGLDPTVLNGLQDRDEAEIVALAGQAGSITVATNMAGRGTDIKICPRARELGGLHVIGTEAHDSSRIDDQLAGRAGRQGDPGSCQFFISAEDHLARSSDTDLERRFGRFAHKDGEITGDLTSAIRRAQLRVELQERLRREDLLRRDSWLDSVRENYEALE